MQPTDQASNLRTTAVKERAAGASRSLVQRKRLVFRLSSLGDVILATAVLHPSVSEQPVDWVVAREFSAVLRGHPGIGKLWEFDRSTGMKGWLALCRQLFAEGYDEVYDLHDTLRTRVARLAFRYWGGLGGQSSREWQRFSKARWKLLGLYIFKRFFPLKLRPQLFVSRFSKFSGGKGSERPNLSHLLSVSPEESPLREVGFPKARSYFCVMPGSKWRGKRWPVAKFVEVIERSHGIPVILGSASDLESLELVARLKSANLPHLSGVGRWNLAQAAQVLASSMGYLGNDTGLAHLAEAVGVASLVIYGPTTPEMGFGPWRSESLAVGLELGCRPCGKDGRRCYRIRHKYLCMTGLEASTVAKQFAKLQLPEKDQHP